MPINERVLRISTTDGELPIQQNQRQLFAAIDRNGFDKQLTAIIRNIDAIEAKHLG